MLVHLKALNAHGRLVLERTIPVDPLALIEQSQLREEIAKAKGRAFTEGAVPFFATELLNSAKSGRPAEELLRHSISAAMAAWLVDSLFNGVGEDEFVQCNLHFTLLADGRVKYDRIRKS